MIRRDYNITDNFSPRDKINVMVKARVDEADETWFEEVYNNKSLDLYYENQLLEILYYTEYNYVDESFTCTIENPVINIGSNPTVTIDVYLDGVPTGKSVTYNNNMAIKAESIKIGNLPRDNILYQSGGPWTFNVANILPSNATFKNDDCSWIVTRAPSRSVDDIKVYEGMSCTINPKDYDAGDTVKIKVYPADYKYPGLSPYASDEISIEISDDAPWVIDMLPWQKYVSGYDRDTIKVHYSSPRHLDLIEDNPYTVDIWEYIPGKDELTDYENLQTLVPGLTSDETFVNINTSLPELNKGVSILNPDDGTGYLPKYVVRVSHELIEGDGDFAYVIVMPQPPRVKFDKAAGYTYVYSGDRIPFSWDISGSGTDNVKPEVVVKKNNEVFTASRQKGNSIRVKPSPVDEGVLKDIYTVTVTVEANGMTALDTITFEVYNPDALELSIMNNTSPSEAVEGQSWFATTVAKVQTWWEGLWSSAKTYILKLDNSGLFDNLPGNKTAASLKILERNRQIDLSSFIKVDTDTYNWQPSDSMTWESDDSSVASLNRPVGSLWYNIEDQDAAFYRPATEFYAVGHQDGTAIVTTTHMKTGLTATVEIEVNTLRDKLYLLTVSPACIADVTYTNKNNDTFTLQTNEKGEVAIYEPDGITGDIKFKAERDNLGAEGGKELYLGSIDSAKLETGEQDAAKLQLYPMNRAKMRPATNQTFIAYKPNGDAYTGDMEVYGGLFKNDIFFKELKDIKIKKGENGKFTLTMDSTQLGNDLNSTGKWEFVYEILFLDGGFAPRLITMSGYANYSESIRFDDAILHLKQWNGQGYEAVQYQYKNSCLWDVTDSNSYVGPNNDDKTGFLSARIVTEGNADVTSLTFVDEFGYTPPKRNVRSLNTEFEFLSGKYSYWELGLAIDEDLKLKTGETRQYAIRVEEEQNNIFTKLGFGRNTIIHSISMPFCVFNGVGLVKPKVDYQIENNLSNIMPPFLNIAGINVANIIPNGLSIGLPQGPIPFRVSLDPTSDPTVYKLRMYYTTKDKDSKDDIIVESGDSDFLKSYNKIKEQIKDSSANKKAVKENTLKDPDKEFQVFVEFEFKYQPKTGDYKWDVVDAGVKFSLDAYYSVLKSFPIYPPANLHLYVSFGAGINVDIELKLKNAKLTGEYERLSFAFDINGYVIVGAGLALEWGFAGVGAGAYGKIVISAKNDITLIGEHPTTGSITITGDAGLDWWARIGPKVKVLGVKLYLMYTGKHSFGKFLNYTFAEWPKSFVQSTSLLFAPNHALLVHC